MKRITFTAELIKEEEGGYTVYCPELDIYTQGDDIEDATKNLKQAAELHIEELGIEFKLGASPSSFLCHCQAQSDEAISRNVPPLGLPRLRLAMTEKRGWQ